MFKGCYDGNYHNINNFNVNWQGNFAVGLFSSADNNALIKNLVVYGEVYGSKWTGGIVGSADQSTIDNCAFIGSVSSDQFDAGGIVGKSDGGLNITSCYHNGTVGGGRYASGILGSSGGIELSKGTIEVRNSYHANGKIKAGTTENSYGIAAIDMKLLNETYGDNAKDHIPEMIVSNCYVTTGLSSNIGCPYAKSDNTTSLIQSQMKQIATDLGEAFVTNVDETLNNGYPVFKWQGSTIKGDVNMDGRFDISDIVLFQKWLLADPNVKLTDWKSVDYLEDDRLDVFDFCLMKKALIEA